MDTQEMTLEFAETCLNLCQRSELRDHYFGDREISWYFEEIEVAYGHFSINSQHIAILEFRKGMKLPRKLGEFFYSDAQKLVDCGASVVIARNDEVGPDEYRGA